MDKNENDDSESRKALEDENIQKNAAIGNQNPAIDDKQKKRKDKTKSLGFFVMESWMDRDDKTAFWTMILSFSTILLVLFTGGLIWYAKWEFAEHKLHEIAEAEKSNAEMIDGIMNDIASNYQANEIIMLADEDLLTFVCSDTSLNLPKDFPIFKIDINSYPGIKKFSVRFNAQEAILFYI